MKKHSLIVGSRGSALARAQVVEVFSLLKKARTRCAFEHIIYDTQGDKDKTSSLIQGTRDDFFTDALDQAVLRGEIDVAIHSAKDLPKQLNPGLKIFALTRAIDETDAFVGKKKLSQLPAGSRIGTSSLLRKEGILAINPKVKIVDIRGTIQERLAQFQDGKYEGVIIATCALKRLGLEKHIVEILPWEGTPLQGQLAVVGRQNDLDSEEIFVKIDVCKNYGKVYLIGAGPGDPDLMTVKGVDILRKVDCVFYDYLVHERLLDYAPFAKKISVGKRKGQATLSQSALSVLLRRTAMSGLSLARLKGGDPLIFGRGADEILYLRSYHIDVEVVPGVTSATGIPSSLGLPLTARGVSSSVAFVSGHGPEEQHHDPQPIQLPKAETLVFLMGLSKLALIVKSLRNEGWPDTTPIAIVSKGTCIEEKIVKATLADIEERMKAQPLSPPALIVVGQTVKFLNERLHQQETLLYLGTYPEKYRTLGRLIHFPMLKIAAAKVSNAKAFISDLKKADIILLTSRCGVKYFFEFLKKQAFDFSLLTGKDFVVIGQDTHKQLNMFGYFAKLVSHDETSEGLLVAMKKSLTLKGQRIIFPRSALSNPYLKIGLRKAGAKLKEVVVYTNTKLTKRSLPREVIDGVIFSSPSTLTHFLQDFKKIPASWKIWAKGTRTQRALQEAGYESDLLVSP